MSGILLVVILGIILFVPLLLGWGAAWFQNRSRSSGGSGLPRWRRLAKDQELSSRLLAALLVANVAGFLMLGVFLLFLQEDAGIREESSTHVAELERRLTRIETLLPWIFQPGGSAGTEKGRTTPEKILTALAAFAGLALGGVVLFRAKTTGAALGGALLASVGLLRISDPTLFSFGSILSFDHLLKIEASSPEGPTHSHGGPDTDLEWLGRIGPFVSGSDVLEPSEETDQREKLRIIVQKLSAPRPNHTLGYVLLVGSADKRSLGTQARKRFGSNRRLAEERAYKVKQMLLEEEELKKRPIRFRTDVNGPLNIGPRTSDEELQEDRSVAVWAAWITEEPAPPVATGRVSSGQKPLSYEGGSNGGRGGGI